MAKLNPEFFDLDPSWFEDEDQLQDELQQRQRKLIARRANGYMGPIRPHQPAPQAPQQAPGAPQAPQGHGQAIAVPFATGGHRLNMAMYTHPVAQSQAQHLQGMIDATTSAWQDENDSRVAQAREQARMDHETQLEAMRNEAMLQRLQKELEDRERERRARNGGLLRRINGGDWEVV